MGGGATGPTWGNVKEHKEQRAWKDSGVEKATNIERDPAAEHWVGNFAR